MLTRNKKDKRKKVKKTADGTPATEINTSSSETSSESNCDLSKIKIEVGMPQVYYKSNSLFGTFGLLDPQKPEGKKIKLEPVDQPSDALNSIKVSLNEENVDQQPDEIISQGDTDASKNLIIIADFCVENDNEDELNSLNEVMEQDVNVTVPYENDIPVSKDFSNAKSFKEKVTDIAECLDLNVESSVEKDKQTINETSEQKESDAGANSEISIDNCFSIKVNNVVNNGQFCEVNNHEEAFNVMEHEDSIMNKSMTIANELSTYKKIVNEVMAKMLNDTSENFVCKSESVEMECKDVLNTIKEQVIDKTPVISQLVYVKKEPEDSSCNENEDFEVNNEQFLSTITPYIKQNDDDVNEDNEKFSVEEDSKNFINNIKRRIKREEDTDYDIAVLNQICKVCRDKHACSGFCTHFPLIVE